MRNTHSVAFIGSAGVPNNYGGFEAFLEHCTPLLVRQGYCVTVTCNKNRYLNQNKMWNGVNRIFINISANGWPSVFHDFVAFFRVFLSHENIVVLGVSGGVFFPLFRLFCMFFGQRLIVNIDGVEFRRKKFGWAKKNFLRISDYLSQLFSHVVIIDNRELRSFVLPSRRNEAIYIPYPGDHVQFNSICPIKLDLPYLLTICRIEPENNCHVLLSAFDNLDSGYYVFIGNWSASDYGRKLKHLYNNERLILLDPIYDQNYLSGIRSCCAGYIHGHSVGGTNPSLVEMLFYNVPIAVFDCVFNRSTAKSDVDYFSDVDDLSILMSNYLACHEKVSRNLILEFKADYVVGAYISCFKNKVPI